MIGGVGSATHRSNNQQQAALQRKIFDKEIRKKKNIPTLPSLQNFLRSSEKVCLAKWGYYLRTKILKVNNSKNNVTSMNFCPAGCINIE